MTGHLDPNPDNDYVYRMPDLFLNGCNLSDTLVFLPKLSTATLVKVFAELILDYLRFPDSKLQTAIKWHIITVRDILVNRS